MAANGTSTSQQTEVESIVNRWLVDYYLFLALEAFKNEKYDDFCKIRDLLDYVLARPLQSTDAMPTKIQVLQFLSRIIEGERLDVSFDCDLSKTPLESALMFLEDMNREIGIPQQDLENVCSLIKEMIVGILIKNNEFDKAEEVLNKHFPKPMVGKKAIFMGLIRQKSKMHEVIRQINFHQFKAEMFAFCQRLFPFRVPFLHKAATQLIDERLREQDDKAAGPHEEGEPGTSSSPQINTVLFVPCKHTIILRSRLEAAYTALATDPEERTFAQLEEEVAREEQARKEDLSLRLSPSPKKSTNQGSEQERLLQSGSGSPMEASPADQQSQTVAAPQTQADSVSRSPLVLRNRQLYTVARLVVEPDSQTSSQCSTASQELETELRKKEPSQSTTIYNKKDPQSPQTDNESIILSRKYPRRAIKRSGRTLTRLAELSTDSEEDSPGSVANKKKLHNQSKSSLSSTSTKSRESSSDSKEDPQLASDPLSNDPGNADDVCIMDSSLDSPPDLFPRPPIPQKSSTPQKDSGQEPSVSKWKQLYNNAKESKERWSDEESYFTSRRKSQESTISNSGLRKRKWTESETKKLKEGVRKFGEGNWSKIKDYYKLSDRTNVNLKDRWRTLKRSNMV